MPFPLTFVDGKVGIGVSNPDAELDITGDVEISGTLTVAGAAVAGLSIGAFGSTPNANGLSLALGVLTMQPADLTHPGGVSIAAQTFNGAKTFDDGVISNSVTSATAAPVALVSSVANGASAVAVSINSSVALSTSGAKLLSILNNSVEKAYFDKDGALSINTGLRLSTSGSDTVIVAPASGTSGNVYLNNNAENFATINHTGITSGTGATFALTSSVANGASAVGTSINTAAAYSTAGAKLLSVQNNSVEKAYVDKDGRVWALEHTFTAGSAFSIGTSGSNMTVRTPTVGTVLFESGESGANFALINSAGVEVDTVGQSFILKSPDGTRWKLSVADTTGVLTAVLA